MCVDIYYKYEGKGEECTTSRQNKRKKMNVGPRRQHYVDVRTPDEIITTESYRVEYWK